MIDYKKLFLSILAMLLGMILPALYFGYIEHEGFDWLWIMAVALFVFLPCFAIIFLYLYYLFIKLRKKGYNSPFTYPLIVLGIALGLIAGYYVEAYFEIDKHLNFNVAAPLAGLTILYSTMVGLTTTIIVLLLPIRKPRVYGPRKVRFPFAMIGTLFIAVCVLSLICIIPAWIFLSTRIAVLFLIIPMFVGPLGAHFKYMAKRMESSSMNHVTDDLSRSLVLYLRTFNQESDWFIVGRRSEVGSYSSNEVWSLLGDPLSEPVIGITFEQYFYRDLSIIGSFVALGSPEDYVPPEGASRIYADDKDWMEYVKDLSQRAACILIEVGKSENLKWELKWLKKAALQEKLFVITRPQRRLHITDRILQKIKGIDITWKEFAEGLLKIGYFLSPADPGTGSVLTFNKESKGILLTTSAKAPSDFVNAIQNWRLNGKYLQTWD